MGKIVRVCRLEMPICNLCVEGDDAVTIRIRCMQERGFSVTTEAHRPSGRPPMQSMLVQHRG